MNLPLELLAFIKTDDCDKEALPAPSKGLKCERLCDATNQFGYLVTGNDSLATFLKGFVPENTKLNTQWSFQSWISWQNKVYIDDLERRPYVY